MIQPARLDEAAPATPSSPGGVPRADLDNRVALVSRADTRSTRSWDRTTRRESKFGRGGLALRSLS